MISSFTGQPGVHWFTRFVEEKKKRKETGSSSQRDERTVSEEDVPPVITASSLFFFFSLLHQNITFSFWATAQGVKNHFHSQA